ncbi:unnamed protein product [Boreogadus saida]
MRCLLFVITEETKTSKIQHLVLPLKPKALRSSLIQTAVSPELQRPLCSTSSLLLSPKSRMAPSPGQGGDTVKLEDFLSQQEEDLWRPRGKQRLSVGQIHLVRSVRYEQLQAPEPGGPRRHTKGARVNQAFVQAEQSL